MVNFLTMIGAIGLLATALTLTLAFGLYGERAYVLAAQVASVGATLGVSSLACLVASHALHLLEQIARSVAETARAARPAATVRSAAEAAGAP
jgi:hypothetical protein